jgi:hypothetical protein
LKGNWRLNDPVLPVRFFGLKPFMLPVVFQYPDMDFQSVRTTVEFKRLGREEILAPLPRAGLSANCANWRWARRWTSAM